ncbi:MAG TPA: hypothetical protein VH853_01785 [Polyangia bacterium]|nr:hypothetical protein [Polyangia bacterium]
MTECMQGCVASDTTSTGGACSNQSAIIDAGNACLAKTTCAELEACAATVPQCAGGAGGASGTGTGGTNGAAGTSGSGGATGSAGTSGAAGGGGTAATCAACANAPACCTAIATIGGQSTASCAGFSEATCNAATGTQQSTLATACQELISGGASLSTSCK